MLRWFRTITFGLLACHVAACSNLSPEQRAATCAQTDWQRYGENDGRLGVATSDRAGDFRSCANVGQPVDLTAYQTGRARGLESYCTAENGYRVGYEGRSYDRVCPSATEPDFLQGYERGRQDRPALAISPGIGIGIGSGGVRTRVGIGIGLFSGHFGRNHYRLRHCTPGRFCW
ncbi:MAG: DUF2799 domain-containing protein [Pseudomonadota bacterium]